ncbi:MAG: MBL fold metallo-hydrolase, partial [Oscillospiraceae bacterium]|nr:MBL fold metallo-hydrolase [Oscillospiraceae bacterium]
KDHIGGADTIIKNFGVKKVIVPNYGKQSKQYSQFVSAMLKMKLESDILTETMEFTLDNTEFTLYPPLLEYYDYNSLGDENDENDDTESDIPNENDFSIVVRAEHGENNFLFAADAAKGRLGELMANEDIMAVKYDFLKVPYHGRYSKRSLEFIDAVKPKYAVITCSADSGDKSGDQRVISALEKNGAEVYLTPNGGVYCVSNGYAMSMIQPFGF